LGLGRGDGGIGWEIRAVIGEGDDGRNWRGWGWGFCKLILAEGILFHLFGEEERVWLRNYCSALGYLIGNLPWVHTNMNKQQWEVQTINCTNYIRYLSS
jgi:hypothetical protein